MVITHLKEVINYYELLYTITLREIKIRYKQSVLGIAWAVLKPLSLMLVFTVIFSRFAKIPSDGIPYPIFSYTGLLPWSFFAAALSFAIPSLVSNASIVTKIYFPREIFPIASILAASVDFMIASTIFALLMLFYNIPITIHAVFIVLILPIQIVFTMGIALLASAINVYYRDVRYAFPLIIQIWMYVSPIIYPVSLIPERIKPFYMLNPMAPIIDGYRRVLIQGQPPDFFYLGVAAVVSSGLLIVSYGCFKKVEMAFADII